eukprot:g19096.t1
MFPTQSDVTQQKLTMGEEEKNIFFLAKLTYVSVEDCHVISVFRGLQVSVVSSSADTVKIAVHQCCVRQVCWNSSKQTKEYGVISSSWNEQCRYGVFLIKLYHPERRLVSTLRTRKIFVPHLCDTDDKV